MTIRIVRGWTNGKEEYRVYENFALNKRFETYEEAFAYRSFLHAIERATISDDEHAHRVDDTGKIIFNHEKGAN
jgi:hypothetical protein